MAGKSSKSSPSDKNQQARSQANKARNIAKAKKQAAFDGVKHFATLRGTARFLRRHPVEI